MGADRKRYICVTPCWHLGSRYFRGDEAMFADNELPRSNKGEIRHFELVMPGKSIPVAEPVVVVNSRKKK